MLVWAAAGAAICALVLLLRWAYRFAADQQRTPGRGGNAGTLGSTLLLVGVVTGSAAAGGFFADRPAGEPPRWPAGVVLACGALLTLVGAAVKAGAARRPSIHVAGVRGRAYVRSIRRADAKTMQGLPVYEMDMDVQGPDVRPFRVVHYEAMPERMAAGIRPGATWPVLIEPATKRVAIDWISPPPVFDEDFDDPPPSIAPVGPPEANEEPVPAADVPTAGTRTIALVLVMVMLGSAAGFVGSLLDSDAPIEIVSEGEPARPRVGAVFAATDTGFSTPLPEGWAEGGSGEGLALRSGDATIRVTRSPRLEARLRRLEEAVPLLFREVRADLGDVETSRQVFVGVEPAMRYDLAQRGGSKSTLVVIARNEDVYVVRLVAAEDEWESGVDALTQMIDLWQWYEA